MPLEVGTIETVAIRQVWPTENVGFTPWLQRHIGELDKVLGLGLSDPQREVSAGAFSIDLVAETNFGDVVIENQFGRSGPSPPGPARNLPLAPWGPASESGSSKRQGRSTSGRWRP